MAAVMTTFAPVARWVATPVAWKQDLSALAALQDLHVISAGHLPCNLL